MISVPDASETVDRNCTCCSVVSRRGYVGFVRLQNKVYRLVSNFYFEVFSTAVIVINVISMAINYYGMSDALADTLQYINYVRLY